MLYYIQVHVKIFIGYVKSLNKKIPRFTISAATILFNTSFNIEDALRFKGNNSYSIEKSVFLLSIGLS